MKKYNTQSRIVRNYSADKPVNEDTVIPSIEGWPGMSDEIHLKKGEYLQMVENGSPTQWAEYIIKK